MKKFMTLVVFAAAVSFSCKDAGVSDECSSRMIPGEVFVGFVDSVDYHFIRSFISDLHLTPKTIYADSAFVVQIMIDSGTAAQHIERLKRDSAVSWAGESGIEGADPKKLYLRAGFKGTVSLAYAKLLIKSIQGISWYCQQKSSRTALIYVKVGQEGYWTEVFKTYPCVKWAYLNYTFKSTT